MNWLMFLTGILQFGASVIELSHRRYLMAVVYFCYGISACVLAAVKGQ